MTSEPGGPVPVARRPIRRPSRPCPVNATPPQRSLPRRVLGLGATLALAAAVASLLASPSQARGDEKASANSVACSLVSPAQVRAIVGLAHSEVVRNHDATVPISEAVNTECDVLAWSGSTPASLQAAFRLAKSGHGAQVGIETWAPNDGSPNVDRWLRTDYDELTGGFDIRAVVFPWHFTKAGMPAKFFKPQRLGHDAAAFTVSLTGPAKGLAAAVGCWWNDEKSSALCLFDEEAAARPVVARLNKLAHVAVPKLLG
jgi:hypothetical protein